LPLDAGTDAVTHTEAGAEETHAPKDASTRDAPQDEGHEAPAAKEDARDGGADEADGSLDVAAD
jgi:hypothetical protein